MLIDIDSGRPEVERLRTGALAGDIIDMATSCCAESHDSELRSVDCDMRIWLAAKGLISGDACGDCITRKVFMGAPMSCICSVGRGNTGRGWLLVCWQLFSPLFACQLGNRGVNGLPGQW
jgi:hypothetical protein